VSVRAAAFEPVLIRVHRERLARVVACLVRLPVVHVEGNADLGKQARVLAHVFQPFLPHGAQLISEIVANRSIANADGERGTKILAS
jgi:hypothetical protein